MDKLILIESNDTYLVNKKLSSLNKDNYKIEYIDMSENIINDVIVELDSYNFIYPNRIVVLTNTSKMFKEELDSFEKYINNPNPDNVLVLLAENLDNRKKITKTINKLFKKIEVEINPINYIKDNLEEYKMDNNTIIEMVNYLNNDISSIDNELEKLKLLKLDEKEITIEDIHNVCMKKINENDDYIFDCVDAIINKDKKRAIEIYNDLKLLNVEPISLLGLIASNFRSMLQVSLLKNNLDTDIASILKMHPYRVKKIKEKLRLISEKEIKEFIKRLYQMDLSIKKGDIDPSLAIELLILK